jgi:signal transduction histidine kinase
MSVDPGNIPHSTARDSIAERWLDVRMISAMRLMLAASALAVIYIEPPKSAESVAYAALILYTVYSFSIYLLFLGRGKTQHTSLFHWLDVAWYVLLITLTGGSDSIFFFFLFFAILEASFLWGYSSGLWVTGVSTVVFAIVAYASTYPGPPLEVNRFLLRCTNLLMLGYLIAFWGGLQSRLRARLKLLKDVSRVFNPRFGVDRTIQSVIEALCSSFEADTCLLILPKAQASQTIRLYGSSSDGPYLLYRSDRDSREPRKSSREITEEISRVFLTASPSHAVIYRKGNSGEVMLYDIKTGSLTKSNSKSFEFISAIEGKSCFSVPVHYRAQPVGRLYIVGGPHRFDQADIDFLLQIVEQVTHVLENIRLVDSLASDAALQERRKIAQDIHDSVIQPYIGLQFGLAAVRQKLENREDVLNNVKELLELTNGEIDGLRSYIGGLKRGEFPQDSFLLAVRRFASKFSEVTGLNVEVTASDNLPIYDRLAAELFQMIEEGLSNVRKHSNSSYAKLEIVLKDGLLEMQLRNERLKRAGEISFTPASIAERTAALGGQTVVYTDNNETVVCIQIPL